MPLNGEYEPSKAQFVRDQVELYESSGGTQRTTSSVLVTRREDERLRDLPVVILSTLGAKSGKIRKTPLMRVEHDGFYAVVASMAGAPRTLHGVTKPVTLTAEIGGFGDGLTPGSKVIGVSATTEISRAAFEAGPAIPTAVVSDKIKIELDIEAVLQA